MNIALVFGCARSGTSILGELIAAHPEVKYIFEAHQIWEIAGTGENGSHRLTARQATAPVEEQIRQWFRQQAGTTRLVVEKNPRNVLRVPFIRAIFPEAKLIHVIRDGRDVACSMVPGCGGTEWQHLKPPSWQEFMRRAEGPVRCAMAWREIMEIALADLADAPHLPVRYEDMLRQPRKTADEVMNFLSLDMAPVVADFCDRIQNRTAASYQAQHQTQWSRNDHSERIGRWRENLSSDQQRLINKLLAGMLGRLGYE
jgi:hypothetical protein